MITPILQRRDDKVFIIDPPSLADRQVVAVDAMPCGLRFSPRTLCGLVSSHHGECWECAHELVAAEGPWVVVK